MYVGASPPPREGDCGHQSALQAMLTSIRSVNRGVTRTRVGVTTHSFLILKNREKCRLILDPSFNKLDRRRPRPFRLANLEDLGERMARNKGQMFMTKTDIQNCYWSFILPP